MAEFVAGIIDRLRTAHLHQYLARLVLLLAGVALVVVCSTGVGASLDGVVPTVASLLLVTMVIWPESIGTIGFLAVTALWWLIGWQGSIWATVPVAALVAGVHLIAGLVGGPPHAAIRLAAVKLLGSRLAIYLLVTLAVSAVVVMLAAVSSTRVVAWLGVLVVIVGVLVATLAASITGESGPVVDDFADDEPYERDDLS